jgi:hypothetical protein
VVFFAPACYSSHLRVNFRLNHGSMLIFILAASVI